MVTEHIMEVKVEFNGVQMLEIDQLKLTQISWTNHLVIISGTKDRNENCGFSPDHNNEVIKTHVKNISF